MERETTSGERGIGAADTSTFFAQMALELHDEPNAGATVERIAEYARIAVGCADAGIMLVHARRHVETAAATSPRVTASHDLQMVHDEGPCLEAIEGEAIHVVPDTANDPRWTKWGQSVHELGICSAASIRLETRGRRWGSLNLYADECDGFSEDDLAVAAIFSRHASVALAAAHNEDGLQVAIDARKLIGQAQGILMERFDIDDDRAFTFLRRQSQTRNEKLRDVAAWIVEHRGDPDARIDAGE